jgi:hypothetical protein
MSKDDDSFTEGKLFQPEAPQYRCGSCRDTGKWSNGIVCPPCGGASVQPEAPKVYGQGYDDDCNGTKPEAHLAKQNENALSMTAPKGQEHTEHDLETVVAAVETILTKYELSHDETNDYVESIMRVVWCQKEGDYERKQYVSTLQRDLAAANARADAAERKLASLTNQTAGARYLINAFDENSLSPVEVIEVMRKVFK